MLDEFGEPVKGMRVETSVAGPEEGVSSLPRTASYMTNDRGEFLWVVGPGKYLLKAAGTERTNTKPEIRDGIALLNYGPLFFPGVIDQARAQVIDLAPGDSARGLVFRLSRQRGMVISGVVSGMPPGNNYGTVAMRFGADEQSMNGFRTTAISADGKYEFTGLTPGYYNLAASVYVQNTPLAGLSKSRRIEGDTSIDLKLSAESELLGRLDLPPGLPAKSVTLKLIPTNPQGGIPMTAVVDADGSFGFSKVYPTGYRVSIATASGGASDGSYVDTVQLEGAALRSDKVELPEDLSRLSLRIKIGGDGGSIAGRLLDGAGDPLASSIGSVFLMRNKTDPSEDWISERLNADGTYAVKGVRPGKYFAFAFDYVHFGIKQDMKTTLAAASKSAVPIEIGPGAHVVQDLRVAMKESAIAKP